VTKRGVPSSVLVDGFETPSNSHAAGDGDERGVALEKGKAADGFATRRERGAMDALSVDGGLSDKKAPGISLMFCKPDDPLDVHFQFKVDS
jgi:hypothetical protein